MASLLHQQECLFNGGSLDVGRINNEERGHNNNDRACPEHWAWVMIYFKFQSWSKTSLKSKDLREQMSSLCVESEMWMFSLFSILSDVPHLLLPVILCSCGCGTLQMVKQGCGHVTLHPVAQDYVSTFLWWCHFPQSFHHSRRPEEMRCGEFLTCSRTRCVCPWKQDVLIRTTKERRCFERFNLPGLPCLGKCCSSQQST